LSLSDAFLGSSNVQNDEQQKETVKFGASMIDDASTRKSFPLLSREMQENICPRKSLRLNSDTDHNELIIFDTSNEIVGISASITEDENVVSRIQNENEAVMALEDQNNKISTYLEFTDFSFNKITEKEPDSLEHVNRNIDYTVIIKSETAEIPINSVNSVDETKTTENKSEEKKQFILCDVQEIDDLSISSEISPRRKMDDVLRQLETTLTPK
jgi:hypothetical protein